MRKRLIGLAIAIAATFGWFGAAAPAHAIAGTSVTFDALQPGLPTTLKLSNTPQRWAASFAES